MSCFVVVRTTVRFSLLVAGSSESPFWRQDENACALGFGKLEVLEGLEGLDPPKRSKPVQYSAKSHVCASKVALETYVNL